MKKKINYNVAKNIADRYVELLKPFCDKIQIAGSVRRRCPTVGDIEIVCIPKTEEVPNGMFDTKKERVLEFTKALYDAGIEILKGKPQTGKYIQLMTPEKIQIDLFMANRDNWGAIYLIRTGDWKFSKYFMGTKLPRRGYRQKGGYVWREDVLIPVRTEKSLFELVGLEYIAPQNRTMV